MTYRATFHEPGERFGRLTIVARAGSRRYKDGKTVAYWTCRCDCGAEVKVHGPSMRRGKVRSCGCLKADENRARILPPRNGAGTFTRSNVAPPTGDLLRRT